MVNIQVLCIATEKESKECTDLYLIFKRTLQVNNNTIKIYDVNSVKEEEQRRGRSNKLADKLEKKMDNSHVILVICSPALKSYLDNGKPTELLKEDERKKLLTALAKHKEKKVLLVYLEKNFSKCIPDVLQGIDVLDGINDMCNLLEVKIPAKYALNMKIEKK
jgi:hypothetical protein